MFLLFCLLLRCHEGSSVERFSLAKVLDYGALVLERPTLLLVWDSLISQDIAGVLTNCQHNSVRIDSVLGERCFPCQVLGVSCWALGRSTPKVDLFSAAMRLTSSPFPTPKT